MPGAIPVRITHTKVRRRIFLFLLIGSCAMALLLGRLVHITVIAVGFYHQKADDLLHRDIPVQAQRGAILDSEGQPLVYTASAATIIVVPAQIVDPHKTALLLARIIGGTEAGIYNLITKRASKVILRPHGRRLDEARTRAVRALRLPGVYLAEEGKRTYPYGDLAAQVLGITGGDAQGLTGIEREFNRELEGTNGAIRYVANAHGQEIPGNNDQYVAPVPGDDVELTLNKQIQLFAQREIANVVGKYHPDSVAIIVENPKTGSILAMADYPTFDPADWRQANPAVYNRNLAIWQTFEPGSTFKIVTLAAALQEKRIQLDDKFYDPGYYEVAGHRIRCWKAGGHGSQSYLNVVENSCNPGFVSIGERLGKTALFSFIHAFGFGKKTGIALPGEGRGILFAPERVGPLELATTSFGQGVSVTPIQQVMAMGAIANGGELMQPQIVKDWIDAKTGQIVRSYSPRVVRRVISPQVAQEVRAALESVVARGTGANAYRAGYRIAGKTGTAQVAVHGHYSGQHYIVSFVGMAPANNPDLVAYVAIDYPRPSGPVFGGTIAAPVIGNLLADSLQYLGVRPSTQGIPKKYRYGIDAPLVTVPDISHRSLATARRNLMESGALLTLQVVGSGPYVVAQAPGPGASLPQGSTVRIYLGPDPHKGG
jgi:stage V sporulation protein D (sporulation-specific penicillin-binding protein)